MGNTLKCDGNLLGKVHYYRENLFPHFNGTCHPVLDLHFCHSLSLMMFHETDVPSHFLNHTNDIHVESTQFPVSAVYPRRHCISYCFTDVCSTCLIIIILKYES
jgi:hypothetical protein